jgi:hypothetical protein
MGTHKFIFKTLQIHYLNCRCLKGKFRLTTHNKNQSGKKRFKLTKRNKNRPLRPNGSVS